MEGNNTRRPARPVYAPAIRRQRKLRIALIGPAGSGKTYSALQIARGLAGPKGRIALIDTENRRASLYAHLTPFDVLTLRSFHPDNYVAAIEAAVAERYDVVIVDSLSHAWNGRDGIQEIVDNANDRGNKFDGWKVATPIHNRLIDAVQQSPIHLLATMRVKTDYAVEQDEKGKTRIRKLGLAPVQRDNMEYEFDFVCSMDAGVLTVTKSSAERFDKQSAALPTPAVGEAFLEWLMEAEEAPAPEAAPTVGAAAPGPAVAAQPAPQQPAAPSPTPRVTQISEPGSGQVSVVAVTKLGGSEEGDARAWGIWAIVIERNGQRAEVFTRTQPFADICRIGAEFKKPVSIAWEVVEGRAYLTQCEAVLGKTKPAAAPPIQTPAPAAPATTGSAITPRSGRGRSLDSLVRTTEGSQLPAGE